jgi:hypothetical protein
MDVLWMQVSNGQPGALFLDWALCVRDRGCLYHVLWASEANDDYPELEERPKWEERA